MATVEVELRNYKKRKTKTVKGKKVVVLEEGGRMPLVIRVTSNGKVSRKNTGLYIRAVEWDENKRRVNRKHPQWARLNDALDVLVKEAEGVKADLIKARQPVTGKAVLNKVFATRDFYAATIKLRDSLSDEQTGHKNNYNAMMHRLKTFAPELSIEDITPDFIEALRVHLSTKARTDKDGNPKGYSRNSVIGTLAKMNAVLKSVELKGPNPFDKVTIGAPSAAEVEALDMADIQKLRRYIPRNENEGLAKDTFLFSFYSAGMRSADVLQLRWDAIKGDRIVYEQNKKKHSGKGRMSIPINPVTAEILSRRDRSGSTVFGLCELVGGSKVALRERLTVQHRLLVDLQRVAAACGITKDINFKLARTSFARIANEASGRNVYGIQQAMGHTGVKTTEIYLGSDTRAVDELLKVVYA